MATLKYKTSNGYVAIPMSTPGNLALLEDSTQGNTPFVPTFDPETESVRITPQTLTEAQKAQVRTNIGAAESVDLTGYALKSEMAIEDVDDDSTKKEITLESGLSQEVLIEHQDISSLESKVAIVAASGTTLTAEVGKYYRFDSAVSSLAVTLPTISNATTIQGCVFYLTTSSSVTITFTGGGTVKYHDGYEIKASSTYEINAIWNGAVWVIASIKIA